MFLVELFQKLSETFTFPGENKFQKLNDKSQRNCEAILKVSA